MWEQIKNNPILKTITVALLGVLAFGFAFNIMFGAGGGQMEGEMMGGSSGYSLDNTLGFILALLIKLLLIAIVIGAIIWVVQIIRKNISKDGQATGKLDSLKNDPIVRNTAIIVGAILAFGLVYFFFRGNTNTGYYEGGSMNGNGYYTVSSGLGPQSVLAFLIKLLMLISIIGLGYGVFMFIKSEGFKNLITPKSSSQNEGIKTVICPECKTELKAGWKCCPGCGSDRALKKNEDTNVNEVNV